jgi:hypothetical protein
VRQELDPEHKHGVAQTYVKNERGEYVVSTTRTGLHVGHGAHMPDELSVVLARYETQLFTWSAWNGGRLTNKHGELHATLDEARSRHEWVVNEVEASRLP